MSLAYWIFVFILTSLDVILRHSYLKAWAPREWVQYGWSLPLSLIFWWCIYSCFSALWTGTSKIFLRRFVAVLLLLIATILLWIPFDVYWRYGNYPTYEGYVFAANMLAFTMQATKEVGEVIDLVLFLAIGASLAAFAWLHMKLQRKIYAAPFMLILLFITVAVPSYAFVRPSIPLTPEFNTVRLFSQLLQWWGQPPKFFGLGRRNPIPFVANASAEAPRYNVLFILGESLAALQTERIDLKRDPMPRLHALRESGRAIWFRDFNSNASCTEVSMTSALSGLSPAADGKRWFSATLPFEVFRSQGYSTFLASSQKLSWAGLDLFLIDSYVQKRATAEDEAFFASDNVGIPDEITIEKAKNFIADAHEKNQRFFGLLHLNTTHAPYSIDSQTAHFSQADLPGLEPGISKYLSRYLNSVSYFDDLLGSFLEEFLKTEEGKRTIIFFSPDHGEAFHEHGIFYHCGRNYVEESRIPAFLILPAELGAQRPDEVAELGRKSGEHLFLIDAMPTLFDLARVDVSSLGTQLDGSSLIGKLPTERFVVFSNCAAIRKCHIPHFGIYHKGLKYLYHGDRRTWEVFRVDSSDESASHDISSQYQTEIETMILPFARSQPVLRAILDGESF